MGWLGLSGYGSQHEGGERDARNSIPKHGIQGNLQIGR